MKISLVKNGNSEPSPGEAEKAMGGFVVFNDFSVRDVQMEEMNSGFGPMTAKNFVNAISSIVVAADEVLPIIDDLQVTVSINKENIATGNTAGDQKGGVAGKQRCLKIDLTGS